MDRQEQIEFLVEHYKHPFKRGAVPDADAEVEGGNPGCGDIVRIYLSVDEDGKTIKDVQFTGEGCTISQAAASVLMELLDDGDPTKTLEDALQIDHKTLIEVLGEETIKVRPRCATLALDTLRAAIRKYEREKLMREHGIDPETVNQRPR